MTGAWPYPAPQDDGGASHLVAGLVMPPIELASTQGGTVNLAVTQGRSVVFIYPWTGRPGFANPPNWDDIPGAHGSTPEAQGFGRLFDQFTAAGVSIYGLSGQTSSDQSEFAERLQLPLPLLSDWDGQLQQALLLPTFKTGGVSYLARLTLVIDDGRISGVFYPVHPPDQHADDVLRALIVRG